MAALNLKALAAYLDPAAASAALASTVVDADDAASTGPLALFYANCQGRGLAHWLGKAPAFSRAFPRVRFIAVHDLVDRGEADFTPAQQRLLGACALFIYQPINARHGRFATVKTGVWARLPPATRRVGFAYLYDECCFPLYMARGDVCARGAAAVRASVARRAHATGATFVEAARAVREELARGVSDGDDLFELKARTAASLADLRRREATLDVRVADVVARGGSPAAPLFLTQNHPATALLVACADRVLGVLGFDALAPATYENAGANAAGIPGRVFPPCVYDRPHRGGGAAPAPAVPEFYLELFDRVVLGGAPD